MPSQIDDTTLRMALIGYGSAVLEELNSLGLNTPVVRIGWPNRFIEHGKLDPLHAKYGITPEAVLIRKSTNRSRCSAPLVQAPGALAAGPVVFNQQLGSALTHGSPLSANIGSLKPSCL